MEFIVTVSINNIQLSISIVSCYAEFHISLVFDECHYAECHSAECRYVKCRRATQIVKVPNL
jgi:hypothetical protein